MVRSFKWLALSILWMVCLAWGVYHGICAPKVRFYRNVHMGLSPIKVGGGGIEGFRGVTGGQWFGEGGRNLCVSFERCYTDNSKAGPFRTHACREVIIESLVIESVEAEGAGDGFNMDGGGESVLGGEQFGLIGGGWQCGFDFGNVVKVNIKELKYRQKLNVLSSLSVSCARACFAGEEIELLGRVKVECGDMGELFTNRLKWDVRRREFILGGAGVLRRGGVSEPVCGRRFDYMLNDLTSAQAKVIEKE